MQFYGKTLIKLENLANDLYSVYGDLPITHGELKNFINDSPKKYPHINTILNKEQFRISRGLYKITMPNDGISQNIKSDSDKLFNHLFR